MAEELATSLLLTPVPVNRVRRALDSIEAELESRLGFQRSRDALLRALMDEFDSRWLDTGLTWTARQASDDHPESTFVALAGHYRVGDARTEVELLVYPWLTEPPCAGVKLSLGASALEAVYGFQPADRGEIDAAAKKALVGVALTTAEVFDADGFALYIEDGALEPARSELLRRLLLEPSPALLPTAPMLAGLKSDVVSLDEAAAVWGRASLLASTSGYIVLDSLRPFIPDPEEDEDEQEEEGS